MPERKTLVKIIKITDDDTGMYRIGEIDGGFSSEELLDYFNSHGEYGLNQLTSKLSHLQFQIWSAWRRHNEENVSENVSEGCANDSC